MPSSQSRRLLTVLAHAFVLFLVFLAVQRPALAEDQGKDRRHLLTVTVDRVRESQIDSANGGTGTVASWRVMLIAYEAN